MDYDEKKQLSDNEIIENLAKFNVRNKSEIQQLEKSKRNEIIRELKSIEGITIRQLSRVTGISKSVIDRI